MKEDLLNRILSSGNLNKAYKLVQRNKRSSGVNKMDSEALLGNLPEHKDELVEPILTGKYTPFYV